MSPRKDVQAIPHAAAENPAASGTVSRDSLY